MTERVHIYKVDESFMRLECSQSIAREVSERFTFEVPGAKFMPSYRSKVWDGKVRLFNSRNYSMYAGLAHNLRSFLENEGYDVTVDDDLISEDGVSLLEIQDFIKDLKLPVEPRDYQIRALALAIRMKRAVLISPTASGKSMVAYLISQWFGGKTLIVVPTVSLVIQMVKDFQDYGYIGPIHGIRGGQEKVASDGVTVSTWQSVYEMGEEFFSQFDTVIGDEAHLFKAKSLIGIMTKMPTTKYRFGMTGTLDGAEVNELVLEGLFGKVERLVKTKDLMDAGHVADLAIKVLVLKHEQALSREASYQDEIDRIVSSDARNRFIRNLALSLKGNTLILYSLVEKHGEVLYDMINAKANGKNISFVHGGTEAEDRDNIRTLAETGDDNIIVASYGTFSTGINIRNLHNVIFASPTKSRVRTLQSIGRGLRKGDTKDSCTLFDIADDMSTKTSRNYTLNHLIERIKMYNQEGFKYEMHTINLKESTIK
jgi:superfamily II DNA or RNA helicase